MGESYSRLQHGAPEDELLRLEEAYEEIAQRQQDQEHPDEPSEPSALPVDMRRVSVSWTDNKSDPNLTTGDPA